MSLQCTECSRNFSIKSNLTRHLRMVHSIEVERIDILPGDFNAYHYKCLEGCNISFKYNRELRKHLKLKHEINLIELNLEFPNSEEFNKWLHNEETSNCVQYIHLTATKRKTTGTETYYYECSRTGKRSYVSDTIRKRRSRKWLTKLNRGCTSQIIVNKFYDGSYSVNYFKTHYGHETTLQHVKLSRQDRGAIASKLLLGLPASSVLHSVKNPNGNKRINLLGHKDIVNIRKSFKIDSSGKSFINSFLLQCNNHELNPILFSNIEDFPDDDICVMIMTDYQSEAINDGQIVVVNTTLLKNCDFELITLFVIGEKWENFPAACMFTSCINSNTFELFLMKIKERVGIVKPSVLITNCDEMFAEVWKRTMDVINVYYNPVSVDVDWKINMNRICCDESEVTRIKRKWVYDTIKSLEKNPDESDFIDSLEETIRVLKSDQDFNDFGQYFQSKYNNAKLWADCYKIGELPMNQLNVVGDVLKQYLNEETEVRFDKIFHSLIRFLRDESVNAKLSTKVDRGVFISANDHRHRLMLEKHFNSTNLNDDLWNVIDEETQTTFIIQKFLDKKCCNLICNHCYICLHCFSCSCVDFFIGNSICVHIHYIWMTYFQSIVEKDDDDGGEEEIIIQVDAVRQEETEIEFLKNEIYQTTSLLCCNVEKMHNLDQLKGILTTITKLCDYKSENEEESGNLNDHSYI